MNPGVPAAPAYGLWSLVIINSLVFIVFAFSFTKPKTKRDWRSFGGSRLSSSRSLPRCTDIR